MKNPLLALSSLLLLDSLISAPVTAFSVSPARPRSAATRLFAETALPDISSMRVNEIRQELESHGISTKSFFEKRELEDALKKARAEGKRPEKEPQGSSTKGFDGEQEVNGRSGSSKSRVERLAEEMEKAKKISVAKLRKELKERGISTKSFLEKSEFIKAYAEAVVDGVQKKQKQNGSKSTRPDEPFDPSFRDVVMQKMDREEQGRMASQGRIIDIKI